MGRAACGSGRIEYPPGVGGARRSVAGEVDSSLRHQVTLVALRIASVLSGVHIMDHSKKGDGSPDTRIREGYRGRRQMVFRAVTLVDRVEEINDDADLRRHHHSL